MSVASGAPAVTDLVVATAIALPRRLAALLIDIVVLSILQAVVNAAFGVTHVTSGVARAMTSGAIAVFTTQTVVDWPWLTLLLIGYYAVLEGLFGASLGKVLTGLRVTDRQGRRVSGVAALTRNAGRVLDVLPFAYLLGGALVLTSREHQRLGDRLAGTVVILRSSMIGPPFDPTSLRRRSVGLVAVGVILLAFCGWFYYFGRPPLVIEGLKNTGEFVFRQPVTSYQLGAARFANGSVTYPITYRIASTDQSCKGEVTLRWNGIEGWVPGNAVSDCTPRIYP